MLSQLLHLIALFVFTLCSPLFADNGDTNENHNGNSTGYHDYDGVFMGHTEFQDQFGNETPPDPHMRNHTVQPQNPEIQYWNESDH